MSDVLSAEDVAKRSSYAARSFEWRRPLVKSEDEFLQRIWNLAEDVSALARSHEQMRGERDAAADDLALVARWLEDEVDAGLQIPLPILAALAFSPAVLYDESRAVSGQTADTGTCGECEGDEGWHAEWCPLVGQTGAVTVLDFDKGEARVEPFSTADTAATSTGSGAGPSCDGSAECEARTHTHGRADGREGGGVSGVGERLTVWWELDPTLTREVVGFCRRCFPEGDDGLTPVMLVSPAGVAHHNHYHDSERTHCGHDATGPEWWWRS